jgi:hypothetical protein
MNSLEATAIVSILFVLRFATPLVLTLLFGLVMNRFMQAEHEI